uniref:choice-of-anchor L domain-containing protein n=1 Tax=uncultured Psychroserpens sp. TaxID=255436 RepID=UPI00260D2492
MKKLYILFIFLLSISSFAQDLSMQNGTFNRCDPDMFFDSGGGAGNYGSDENITTTICPENPGDFIILNFTAFSTQLNTDILTIYDGDDITAPLVGTYSGVVSPGTVIASSASGCITLNFQSNATGTTTGFAAEITCAQQCQTIMASIDSTNPVVNGAGVIEIAPGTVVDFNGDAMFSDDGTGATFNWDFGDSNTAIGQSVSNTFNNPGTYNVVLTVTDTNPTGCSGTITIPVLVLEPIVTINNSAYPESSYSPEQLIEDVLVSGGCSGVDNFSFQVNGSPGDLATKSYGYFTKGGAVNFPFEEGIVLSTGRAFPAGNMTNNGALVSFDNNQPGDNDLEAALGQTDTNDATFIKFNFVPTASSISFRYIMFSEEYDGSTECSFADSFAFLLREVGTTAYTNLAVLPDGTPVSVTNINNSGVCTANPAFFEGYLINDTNYGGRTVVLTATANVNPNTTYEIKLVVADEGDSIWDSAIFLEAGSFNLGGELGDDITIAAGTAECGGEMVTLDTAAPSADHVWYKDGVEIIGETSSTIDVTDPGVYSVDVIFAVGCETSDSIVVEFKPSPTANPASDLSLCSLTGTGEFNLTDNDAAILGAQNPTDFVISYHLSEADAEANFNPLTSPYPNISNPQTIYARIADISQECSATTNFDLVFSTLSINTVTPFQICDDSIADGFTMFDLSLKNDEVIGALDPSTVNVTYYATQADADSAMNALSIPYTNTTASNQTIFIRLEANNDAGCYNTTTLDLEVIANPVANILTPLEVCDDDNDGFATFTLTLKDTEVVGSQTGLTVTYHETQSDADMGINPLASPYNNIVSDVQTVYVRVESGTIGCYDTVELTLIVNPLPSISNVSDYQLCDDNAPGDEMEQFDLSTKDIEILNGQVGVILTYHQTQADADAVNNALANPYTNTSNPQTIFYAITNVTSGCVATGTFDLVVNPLPAVVTPTALEVCDDGVPDGLTLIDLTLKNT